MGCRMCSRDLPSLDRAPPVLQGEAHTSLTCAGSSEINKAARKHGWITPFPQELLGSENLVLGSEGRAGVLIWVWVF